MILDIGEKAHELKFNLKFIRLMDNVYNVEQSGLRMGMGVSMAYNALNMYSVDDLATIIRFASVESPTLKQVDTMLEEYADEHGDLSGLFDDLKNALKDSPMTKATIKNFVKNLNQ